MNSASSVKGWNKRLVLLISMITVIAGAAVYGSFRLLPTRQSNEESPLLRIHQVAALGRLKPVSEVVHVSAPVALTNDRIAQLLVQRGEAVRAGQVVAILSSRERLQQALLEAQQQVRVARASLAQVQAGAKQGEISAQQAEIARLEAERQGNLATQTTTINRLTAELQNAQTEYNRYQALFASGAISASQRDSKQLAFETAQRDLQAAQADLKRIGSTSTQALNRARATLNQVAEVRPVDVQVAEAEVSRAQAAVAEAQANLAETTIRAPIDGRVLEIRARAGETVGTNGIVELGQTNQMEVVAEVYQSDIAKIRVGQLAEITSEAFGGTIQGTVHLIGLQVIQQQVSSGIPGENLDQRVVEVRIRLNPQTSQQVAALTNLQVQVAIQL